MKNYIYVKPGCFPGTFAFIKGTVRGIVRRKRNRIYHFQWYCFG